VNAKVRNLLFPDPEFLKLKSAQSHKFQIFVCLVLTGYFIFAFIDEKSVPGFYALIMLVCHCIVVACARHSSSLFLAASTASFVVDSVCNTMANSEMQNSFWMDWYAYLPGNAGHAPCPECSPDMESSWIFGMQLSYLMMFTLPCRNLAVVLPPCFSFYVGFIGYGRWTNYEGFSEALAESVKRTTMCEFMLLVLTVIVAVFAKVVMETSDFKLFLAMKDSQRVALDEKILRCEAEYATECIKTGVESSRSADAPSISQISAGHHTLAARTNISAPPVLEHIFGQPYTEDERMALQCGFPSGGDCLQEDDTVWTTDAQHPIPVKQLLQGQQVLCYDHLSKGLKHAKVLNVVATGGMVQWATVKLVDGTAIRVTADHPFLTEGCSKTDSLVGCSAVRASDLKPHHDQVLVMKLVPIDVESINLDSLEDLKEQTRISIDIQHPARHSIFVSRSGQSATEYTMAVGASNLDVEAPEYTIRGGNTFLNLHLEQPVLRRTNSSPSRLQSTATTTTSTAPTGRSPLPNKFSNDDSDSCVLSSLSSSGLSRASAADCVIRIGSAMRPAANGSGHIDQIVALPDADAKIKFTDYLRVQKSGLPSLGSFDHHNCEACTAACWFDNQRQYGRRKKCINGIMCDRCHFEHPLLKRGRRSTKPIESASTTSLASL